MRFWTMLFFVGFTALHASANTNFAIESAICSGILSSSETGDTAFFGCDGIYQLSHGSITSTKPVVIRATELLDLKGVTIEAPRIELWVLNGQVTQDQNTRLNGQISLLIGPKPLTPTPITEITCTPTGSATLVASGQDSSEQQTLTEKICQPTQGVTAGTGNVIVSSEAGFTVAVAADPNAESGVEGSSNYGAGATSWPWLLALGIATIALGAPGTTRANRSAA